MSIAMKVSDHGNDSIGVLDGGALGLRSHRSSVGRLSVTSTAVGSERPRFVFAGAVSVGWDAGAPGPDGTPHGIDTWVEFPDEVRSLLELAPWRPDVTIRRVLEALATAFVQRRWARGCENTAAQVVDGALRLRISNGELRELLVRVIE